MDQIRTLFSRKHDVVLQKLGVFLAGPTPADGAMQEDWRRKIIGRLQKDERLDANMIVVAPEPETAYWKDIDEHDPNDPVAVVRNKQIPWELQYLQLCDITAFWLPSYWTRDQSGPFDPNIGPTSRWEFGFFFQEYLKHPTKRHFIIGSPEDAQSIKWAKRITSTYGIKWHLLKKEHKEQLVADSFIEEIADTLFKNAQTLQSY